MRKILQSECLKQKHGAYFKLCLVLPFISLFIAFLLCGPTILENFSIYWWEALFLFTLAGLLFVYDYKAEEGAGHFQNTLQGKLTGKIKVAKVMTALKNLFLASCVLLLFLYLVSFVFCGVMTVHFFRDAWVLLLILIASAWNVPLLFYLSKWINCYLVLVLNSFLCLLVAPFLAQTSFWYLFPYTYHYKIAQAILHLKPSGEVEVLNHPHPVGLCIVAISLSVLLFLIFIKALKEQKRG